MSANWRRFRCLFVTRRISTIRCSFPNNPHRYARPSPDDFSLGRVIEPPYLQPRVRVRNDEQLPAINLAPTAHVAVSQLREVDWPFVLVCPFHGTDLSLARINLHQRTG